MTERYAEIHSLADRITRQKDAWRAQDAARSRRQVDSFALELALGYEHIQDLVRELHADGGYDHAINTLHEAKWRMKQAEALLERAKGQLA